jgi:hypothetical protein
MRKILIFALAAVCFISCQDEANDSPKGTGEVLFFCKYTKIFAYVKKKQ